MPSGLHTTELTPSLWPARVREDQAPSAFLHTRTVESSDAEARRVPSGLHTTELTPWLWPAR
eukprot:1360686-Pyramimonas_sp.AAC.1